MTSESPQHHIESKPVTNQDMVVILKDKTLSDESAEAIVCEWIELKKQEYDQNKGLFDGISLELDIVEVFLEASMFDQVAEYLDNAEQLIQHEMHYITDGAADVPPELQVQMGRFKLLAQRFEEIEK